MLRTDFGKTVEEWVEEAPETLLLLERFHLDFETVRGTPMDAVCRNLGTDPFAITVMLSGLRDNSRLLDDSVLRAYDIRQLIAYIIVNHHHFMDEELPHLEKDLDSALREDGSRFPELFPLQLKVRRFIQTFRAHMREEERHFFPYFATLAEDPKAVLLGDQSLQALTEVVRQEDEYLVEDLNAIRQATRWYHHPAGAGDAYRSLIHRLRLLEIDLRRHMAVESEILFQKVLELENEGAQGADQVHGGAAGPMAPAGNGHVPS
ncbi:MAG TPA: hemerythrin domain-containing protein [bacterium]|nr:hemerythrin domain-containing protein [bacterium]